MCLRTPVLERKEEKCYQQPGQHTFKIVAEFSPLLDVAVLFTYTLQVY